MGQPGPLSEESQISLITIFPGDPIYTFAGHSAFRVRDPEKNLDRLYNYGTFDFDDPLFVPKFTYGHLRYFLSVASYRPMLDAYKRQGRPVVEQTLTLTRPQRTRLFRFLQENARPENRYYQYNFFFDNCSTRLVDALEETLGEALDVSEVPAPNRSFRRLLDPYVASRPLMDLGFDLGLGLPADREASAREAMFLPVHLMEAFDHATVTSEEGVPRPLVARTDTVQSIPNYRAMNPATDWPLGLSITFLALVLGWTAWQARTGQRPEGRGDALLFALVGLVGLVICYLWFVATYTVTNYNLNLLWAWPTHVLVAPLVLRRPNLRGLHVYLGATAGATLVVVLAWPIWPQDFHVAVLPFLLGVGIRAAWWALSAHDSLRRLQSKDEGAFPRSF